MADYYLTTAANRVKVIAEGLANLAQTVFDERTTRDAAIRQWDHLREGSEWPTHFTAAVDATVSEARRVHSRKIEAEAIALVVDLGPVAQTARDAAEKARPKRDVSSPQAVMLSRERWDAQVGLLESGRDLRDLIKVADLETVFAIETFAPEYELAQLRATEASDIGAEALKLSLERLRASIRVQVNARLAEIATPDVRDTLQLAHHAEGHEKIAGVWATHLRRVLNGEGGVDALGASLAVHELAIEYGLRKSQAEIRAEQNAAMSSQVSAKFDTGSKWPAAAYTN